MSMQHNIVIQMCIFIYKMEARSVIARNILIRTFTLETLLSKSPEIHRKICWAFYHYSIQYYSHVACQILTVKKIHLPDEIFAVTAESGLFKKSSDKFMVFNLVDILLPQCPPSMYSSGRRLTASFQRIILFIRHFQSYFSQCKAALTTRK